MARRRLLRTHQERVEYLLMLLDAKEDPEKVEKYKQMSDGELDMRIMRVHRFRKGKKWAGESASL